MLENPRENENYEVEPIRFDSNEQEKKALFEDEDVLEFPLENDDDNEANVEEEVIIEEDDDDNSFLLNSQSLDYDPPLQKLLEIINTYNAFFYDNKAYVIGHTIHFQLLCDFLPLSLQDVYGFLDSPVLLNVQIELFDYSWSTKPTYILIEHPQKKDKYVGNPLVKSLVQDFFSEDYHQRQYYRSKHYLIKESGEADLEKVSQLVADGFHQDRAVNALVLCKNKYNDALQFLKTGELPSNQQPDDLFSDYSNCPLLYFVLELAECFFDLQDHCCICRAPITPGLKPTICDQQMCMFQLSQIGLGCNVVEEIRRDIMAADFIFSIFVSAIGSKYFTPRPPGFNDDELRQIAQTLPTMASLATCVDDSELAARISDRTLELLRWVLLSNRTQMIALEGSLQLSAFNNAYQFLSLISTPEAEAQFRVLKDKYDSQYLFHGSATKNWHSIIRNGLKNASNTDMMAHGAAYGSGIYFAHDSSTSCGYANEDANLYNQSALGKTLKIVALCEIAKVPELQCHGWAHTLKTEEACIVRFILVNGSYQVDVNRNPITQRPKLKDVLNYKAELKKCGTASLPK